MEIDACSPPAIQRDGHRLAPAASRSGVGAEQRPEPLPPRRYHPQDHRFPLTFERYFAAAYSQWNGHKTKKPVVFVQVQKRKNAPVLCASVVKLGDTMDHGMWFKVEGPQVGSAWFESRQVRLCSGDGRCVCESAMQAAAGAQRRAACIGSEGVTC